MDPKQNSNDNLDFVLEAVQADGRGPLQGGNLAYVLTPWRRGAGLLATGVRRLWGKCVSLESASSWASLRCSPDTPGAGYWRVY